MARCGWRVPWNNNWTSMNWTSIVYGSKQTITGPNKMISTEFSINWSSITYDISAVDSLWKCHRHDWVRSSSVPELNRMNSNLKYLEIRNRAVQSKCIETIFQWSDHLKRWCIHFGLRPNETKKEVVASIHVSLIIIIFYFENVAVFHAKLVSDTCPRVDNQTSGDTLQDLTRPVKKLPSASYPLMGIGASLWWQDALPHHQPVRIRKESLESENLFSGSWIPTSVPPLLWKHCLLSS